MTKPMIGVVGNILIMENGMFPGMQRSYVNHDYIVSIKKAGGIPTILPVLDNTEDINKALQVVDGIILSGGYDIDSQLYGEEPIPQQGYIFQEVDTFYMKVIKEAQTLKKPTLGICKGIQALNVAFGGTLYQDLGVQKPNTYKHLQETMPGASSHHVDIQEGSFLSSFLPDTILVNSYHHQAVKDVAKGFMVSAMSRDGVIEAIEQEGESFMVGVQWHPEMMCAHDNQQMLTLFEQFLEICRRESR